MNGTGWRNYYRHRIYHALLGRFCSRDPIGYLRDGFSLYETVRGNPIGRTDPDGMEWQDWTIIGPIIQIPYYLYQIGTSGEDDYELIRKPDGSTEVVINKKCIIVVLVGHGIAATPHHFRFRAPCTAGAFVGCDAGSTNQLIPPNNPPIPGFPGYDIPGSKMTDGDLYPIARPTDPDGLTFWVNRTMEQAREKAREICQNSNCCCNEVTIYQLGIPADGGAERSSTQETIACPRSR